MDKKECITKCEALIKDNLVYQHLSKDTSPTIHKELIKILQNYKNNNFISETEYTQLKPHGSNSPAARFLWSSQNPQKQHAYVAHSFSLWNKQHTTLPNSSLKFFKITVARLHPLLKVVQISSRKLNISQ